VDKSSRGLAPTYRRGILDALCYPKGHILEYSYRLRNVHSDLRPAEAGNSRTSLKGIIVFVDVDYGEPDKTTGARTFERVAYFPLRRVTIHKFPSLRSGQPINERERASYFLQLGEFVEYDVAKGIDQWNATIAGFNSVRSFRGAIPQYFVVPGRDVVLSSINAQMAWEDVELLSRLTIREVLGNVGNEFADEHRRRI